MTTLWHNKTTIARRLHVRGSQLDPVLTQLRMNSLLNNMDTYPTALAPSAILCIRRLRDPLPGALQLQQHSIQPSSAWQRAMAVSLNSLVQQAARPALSPAPAHAAAVIFADRAELLACLANDWYTGHISQHWWWSCLFPKGEHTHSILPVWLATPEYIPAALHHLALSHTVIPFVRSLSSNDARTILHSIIRSFSLHHLAEILALETSTQETGLSGKQAPDLPLWQVAQSATATAQSQKMPAPWQPWVPASTALDLSLAQQSLLGIGLMLRHAPTIIRTAACAQAVEHWYQTAQLSSLSSPVELPSVYTSGRREENQHSDLPTGQRLVGSEPAPISPRLEAQEGDVSASDRQARDGVNPWAEASPAPTSQRHQNGVYGTSPRRSVDEGLAPSRPLRSPASHTANRPPKFAPMGLAPTPTHARYQDTLFDATIETTLGGLFYLINLSLFLNLYGDFTTPLQPGISLNIWDFVTLIGQQLLGEPIKKKCVDGGFIPSGPQGAIPLKEGMDGLPGSAQGPLPAFHAPPTPTDGFPSGPARIGALCRPWWMGCPDSLCVRCCPQGALADPTMAPTTNLQTDPLWQLLAQLAGRNEQDPPGHDFIAPAHWHLPPAWLTAFPEQNDWQWTLAHERLLVKHPAGFLLLDLPLEQLDPTEQLTREIQAYRRDTGISLSTVDVCICPQCRSIKENPPSGSEHDPTNPGRLSKPQCCSGWACPIPFNRIWKRSGYSITTSQDKPHTITPPTESQIPAPANPTPASRPPASPAGLTG